MALSTLIENMMDRGILAKFSDSGDTQSIDFDHGYERRMESIERLQDYGLTSFPPDEAQVFYVCLGGNQEYPIVLKVDDPTKRPKLEKGEMSLWTVFGNQIYLKKDGSILAKSKDGAMEISLLSSGKVSIKNQTVDLVASLASLVELLSTATTTTIIGPQPLSVAAQLAELSLKLNTLKV